MSAFIITFFPELTEYSTRQVLHDAFLILSVTSYSNLSTFLLINNHFIEGSDDL